jgi:hypothetical protein
MPVPTLTASRSLSTSGEPASAQASRAATMAVISLRSSRRACTRSIFSVGSAASCAAMRTVSCAAHSWLSADTPDLPASMASQVDGASAPSGVVAPIPVTTTSTLTAQLSSRRTCGDRVLGRVPG